MKELGILLDHKVCSMLYDMHTQAPILQQEEDWQSKILDANYTKVDIDAMVEKLDVKRDIKRKLSKTLKHFKTLFGGGLEKVATKTINLEIKEGTKPYATTYYNVPKMYEKYFRKEVDRMVDNDILECNTHSSDSQWAAPLFSQAMKTGDIQVLTDFREMNKRIKQKPFPLPQIMELLQKIEKFESAMALYLSQGYYNIPLSK